MSEAKGMIIAAPERWDEACFSVPALRALIKSGLVTTLLCRPEQSHFWKTVTELPQIHFTEKTSPAALAKEIGTCWDASLCWEEGTAAKALTKSNIPKRLGPEEGKLPKHLTHPLKAQESPTEHRVRKYIKICEQMGISVDLPEFFAPIQNSKPTPNTILLCPDSDFGPSHEWPLENWQNLAEKLLEKGHQLTIAGLSSGRKKGRKKGRNLGKILSEKIGSQIDFFQANPLGEALETLATHQLTIAVDSSLPHLAAHTGSTCLTLFGPNEPAWKRPLGTRHTIARNTVECAPCLSEKCLLDSRCQQELTVSQVLAAIPKNLS